MIAVRNLLLAFAAMAPAAHAETWQCTDKTTGRSYTVSQAVPVDQCRLISSTNSPHFDGPARSEQPMPIALRQSGACDKAAALDVMVGLREFADWRIEGDHVTVHWTHAIEKETAAKRLRMIKTFADLDACATGGTREIMFYRKGKLMGIASSSTGVQLIK